MLLRTLTLLFIPVLFAACTKKESTDSPAPVIGTGSPKVAQAPSAAAVSVQSPSSGQVAATQAVVAPAVPKPAPESGPTLVGDAKAHVDWSLGNSTGPDQVNCPDQYVATEARCLTEGGRACLMRRAVDSAKANNCSYAMRLTLITQCHSGGAQQQLGAAGEGAVCRYLKYK